MTQFESILNKVKNEASNRLSPWIPMDMQVKGVHLLQFPF